MESLPHMNPSVSTEPSALDPQLWLSGLTPLILPPVPDLNTGWGGGMELVAAALFFGLVMLVAWQWRRIRLAWCLWQLWRRQDRRACCRLYHCLVKGWPQAVLLRRQAEKSCFLPPGRSPSVWRVRRMLQSGCRLLRPRPFR